MDGASKPASHESRKPQARPGRGESRGFRVVTNQKHKHKGDNKLVRDGDIGSPNIKRGEQTEPGDVIAGDSRISKDNSIICTSGSADAGQSLHNSCNARAKRSSQSQAGNFKQPRATRPHQTNPQSKEAGEVENLSLLAQHHGPAERSPETQKGAVHSKPHAEPSSDPVTSSPPCEYTTRQ